MSRALAFSLALSSLLGACALEDDEDIWMPPGSNGKSDGVQIIKGNTIPSQHVSANQDYLTGRMISSLSQIGALPAGDDLELAKRADGIIANLPANGRLEAAELARMESPQIFATLFPNEQAALPRLWPLLEAPSGAAMPVPVPGADLTVTNQSTPPGGLTPPASLAIASLDAAWQQPARRVQLVFNGDGDAATIQAADIQSVLADPQAFTPAEVEILKAILAEFHRRATSVSEAKAIVPEVGTTTKHTQLGMMALEFSSEITVNEFRNIQYGSGWNSNYYVSAVLNVAANASGALSAPAGAKMILVSLGDGSEQVFEGAQPQLQSLAVGDYVLERYDMGARKEAFLLALPGFKAGETHVVANPWLDHVLVTPGGAKLVKNAVTASSNATGHHAATFRHELVANTYPGVDANAVAAVATPWTTLPSGRYEVTLSNTKVVLDLYPQRVAVATIGGVAARLDMRAVLTQNPYTGFSGMVGGRNVQFSPNTNQLMVWLGNQTPSVIVTPAHRTR